MSESGYPLRASDAKWVFLLPHFALDGKICQAFSLLGVVRLKSKGRPGFPKPFAGNCARGLAFESWSTPMKLPSNVVAFARWFDNAVGGPEAVTTDIYAVDWFRCLPFLGVHAMCLGVIWVGWSWVAVGVTAALYFIRMFAITGFYHRYFSHKSYKTTRAMQLAFAVVANSSTQRGPLWWAAHHRHHHLYSDMESDPHSPRHHGFLWSHMGWVISRANFPARYKLIPDLKKYPELLFLDRFDVIVPFLLGTSTFFLGMILRNLWPSLGTSPMQMLIWGYFISTVALFHGTSTINSLAHQMGRKRYRTGDDSRNSFMLALITLGEGWHNNHHHYASSTRQGFYWWEIDITYYLLKAASWTGLIWDLKPVPRHTLTSKLVGEKIEAAA